MAPYSIRATSSRRPLHALALRVAGLRPPLGRALALAALLIAELIAFGVAFDLGSLPSDSSFWSRAWIRSPRVIAVLVAAAMAGGLIGGKSLWHDAAAWYERRRASHRWRLWLALHLVLTGVVYWSTATIFALAAAGNPLTRNWTLIWLTLSFAALGCSGLALFPAALWPRVIWRGRWAVLAGLPLGAVAWLAAWVSGRVGWKLLGDATILLVDRILRFIYPETVSDPASLTVGTPAFAVDVVATCSGYQGIGLICVFLCVYLWLFRDRLRFPHAWMLLPLGVCAIWLANVARIVSLIIVGASGWPEIAHGGFHSQAGWLAFNAVALGFVAYASKSRYLAADQATEAGQTTNSTAAYLAPFLASVLAAMVTSIFVTTFDWYYPVRVLVAVALLTFFSGGYGELRNCAFSWRPVWLGAAAFVAWLWLIPENQSRSEQLFPLSSDVPASWALVWLAAKTVGYVFVTPLVEELAFRGYLLRRLVSSDFQHVERGQFTLRALAISSLVFGLLHGQHWLPASLAGLAFGLALGQRGKLADAIVAHMVVNGLIASVVFATGHWYLWG